MSQGNLEIVRRAAGLLAQAYETGEVPAGLLELCAPDIRVDASPRVFNPDLYDGHAGMRRLVREIYDAWEDFSETTERLLDAGDRVLSIQTIGGRGRTSKAAVQAAGALIWTIREGLVEAVEVFSDPGEALEVLGRGSAGPPREG